MIVSLIALALIASTLGAPVDVVPYSGFRMTLDKTAVINLYTGNIDYSMSQLSSMAWPNFNFTKTVSIFTFGFYVENLKCTKATYDQKGVSMVAANNKIELTQSGPVVTLEFGFKWRFQLFGMDVLYGDATGTAKSTLAKFTQVFAGRDVVSSTAITWTHSFVVDWQDLFGVSKMLDYVFTQYNVPFANGAINKPLSSLTLAALRPWMDIKIPFHSDQSLIVWMMNTFDFVGEAPANYVTLGFGTNLTGVDRPYNKRLFRSQVSKIDKPQACQVCMSSAMVAGILEIENKGKDFLFPVDAKKDLGLTGTLVDLAPYMPKLFERFDLNDALYIGCRPLGSVAIQMINDIPVPSGNSRVQVTLSCDFGDIPKGVSLVSSTVVFRGTLNLKYDNSTGPYNVTGVLSSPKAFSYKAAGNVVPLWNVDGFASILIQIVNLAEGFPILQAGLSVGVPLAIKSSRYNTTLDEACFTYA